LLTQYWTIWFHKGWGISRLSEWLSVSQKGLCSMELVQFIRPKTYGK
jgi:hypothetical protein